MDSNCALQTVSVMSAAAPGGGPPVLRTRTSTLPSTSASPWMAAGSDRSHTRGVIAPGPVPAARASWFKRSRLRATAVTVAPSAARAEAIAPPNPREAPVTKARRFSSPKFICVIPVALRVRHGSTWHPRKRVPERRDQAVAWLEVTKRWLAKGRSHGRKRPRPGFDVTWPSQYNSSPRDRVMIGQPRTCIPS